MRHLHNASSRGPATDVQVPLDAGARERGERKTYRYRRRERERERERAAKKREHAKRSKWVDRAKEEGYGFTPLVFAWARILSYSSALWLQGRMSWRSMSQRIWRLRVASITGLSASLLCSQGARRGQSVASILSARASSNVYCFYPACSIISVE